MRRLLLARHAQAASNVADVVSCLPPGEGLSELGRSQAVALGRSLADEPIDLAVASRLLRAAETRDLAVDGRDVPRETAAELDEIHFGSFEGGPLPAYRAWAWSTGPAEAPPGAGESRVALALRTAACLEALLARPEEVILAVGHALPLRYALDAASGTRPRARMTPVPHASATALTSADVERAVGALRAWAAAPAFADASS